MNDQRSYSRSSGYSGRFFVGDEETRVRASILARVLVGVLAFGTYWFTASVLEMRGGTAHFGADSPHYAVLALEAVNHRAARFHPTTIALALGWMKLFAPFAAWIAPHLLLKAFFAAVGAVGAAAATSVFSALLPRGWAFLAGLLYAGSLSVWYFSGIPESKIVTATLSVFYIAAYVRLRQNWTMGGMTWLSLVFAMACLNEIVSCFLFAIPLIDIVLRRGVDWRQLRWLIPHALVVPVAWLFLEIAVNGWIIPESQYQEGQSHFNMLLYYLAKNDYGLATVYAFLLNWFIFNLAAPASAATLWPQAGSYFEPSMMAYFASPLSAALIAMLAVTGLVSILSRYRAQSLGPTTAALLVALAAYALIRAAFFFIFNPTEPLLFSPAVTLVHWLILLVPFAASRFPAKRSFIAVLAVLLIATNASFMVGPGGWANALRLVTGS